jgi:hypothetical protein
MLFIQNQNKKDSTRIHSRKEGNGSLKRDNIDNEDPITILKVKDED